MSALFENKVAASAVAERLKVFAQPQRLMILSCLLAAERSVGEIAEVTGISQPALSQQLAELRRADLVRTRKEAKQVWYSLASENVAHCVRNMEALFGGEPAPPATSSRASTQQTDHGTDRQSRPGVAGFAQVL